MKMPLNVVKLYNQLFDRRHLDFPIHHVFSGTMVIGVPPNKSPPMIIPESCDQQVRQRILQPSMSTTSPEIYTNNHPYRVEEAEPSASRIPHMKWPTRLARKCAWSTTHAYPHLTQELKHEAMPHFSYLARYQTQAPIPHQFLTNPD